MYNLKNTVNFPTRIINVLSTAIDNFFTDLSRNFTISPLINGLSDHGAYVRNINSFTIYEFQSKLSMESWDDIFEGSDTNVPFNNFLNLYLKIFYACFTERKINSAHR